MESDRIAKCFSVICHGVYKSYGFKSKRKWILKDLNIAIPQGQIFCFLGESGCGKTTLIKCIIGKIAIDQGVIKVMGKEPEAGPRIGYMPQSTSLSVNLTVNETMWLYGLVLGLSVNKINERKAFLLDLLSMTLHNNSMIATLSEGEKRRISLAVALLNEAPLILLDEPTVGIDPILRHVIWQHLKNVVQNLNVTVILTTHYMDEAKHSNNVGFIHNGNVIANSPPEHLMQKYNCTTLEQVFLHVCQSDTENEQNYFENSEIYVRNKKHGCFSKAKNKRKLTFRASKIAIFFRMWLLEAIHNKWITLNQFVIPIIILLLTPLSFDDVPHLMPLAIVNYDAGALGQSFINELDASFFQKVTYNSSETAIRASILGHALGTVIINKDFTKTILQNEHINGYNQSIIQVHLDEIRTPIKQSSILLSFKKFSNKFQNLSADANLPIEFTNDMSQLDELKTKSTYATPGLLICLCLIVFSSLSGIALFEMVENGQLERFNTAGISSSEIVISLALFQTLSVIPFIIVIFIVTFIVNGTPCRGSYVTVFFLIFLQANCGIYLGLLMSAISPNAIMVILLNDALFLVTVMIQDVTLPLVLMTDGLKLVSEKGPSTTTVASLRGILNYGWSISQPTVTQAIITNCVWIFGSLFISLIIFRLKQ